MVSLAVTIFRQTVKFVTQIKSIHTAIINITVTWVVKIALHPQNLWIYGTISDIWLLNDHIVWHVCKKNLSLYISQLYMYFYTQNVKCGFLGIESKVWAWEYWYTKDITSTSLSSNAASRAFSLVYLFHLCYLNHLDSRCGHTGTLKLEVWSSYVQVSSCWML